MEQLEIHRYTKVCKWSNYRYRDIFCRAARDIEICRAARDTEIYSAARDTEIYRAARDTEI